MSAHDDVARPGPDRDDQVATLRTRLPLLGAVREPLDLRLQPALPEDSQQCIAPGDVLLAGEPGEVLP
jgi:hypothetical protein